MPTELTAIPIPPNGKADLVVYEKPVGDLRLIRLLPNDPFTRKLFPAFVERCIDFLEVANSDADEIWLGALLYNNFNQATNYIHCLVALNNKDEIRAHAFSYLENNQKLGIHVHVLQIWKSEGSSEIIDEGMKAIEDYARETKCKTITYSADSVAKLRLYQKYGFSLHRVLGKKELKDG